MPRSLSTDLRSLSCPVMSLVGRNGASGPELVEMAMGAAPLFWTGGGSHVLREARRLSDDGYLSTRSEPAPSTRGPLVSIIAPMLMLMISTLRAVAWRIALARFETLPKIDPGFDPTTTPGAIRYGMIRA